MVQIFNRRFSATIKTVFIVGALGILAGIFGAQFATDTFWIRFSDNLHWTSGTLSAAIVSWLTLKRAKPKDSRTLSLISIGLIAYATGQIVWDVQALSGYSSFPSPSDLFYIWLGPCITAALLCVIGNFASQANIRAILLDTLVLATAALTLILVIYLPKRGDTELLPLMVMVAYPATLFAATITGISMIPALRLRASTSLLILLISMSVTGLSWMKWNYMSLNGENIDGAWFNASFSIAIYFIGFALPRWKIQQVCDARWNRVCDSITRLTPLVAVVIVFVAVLIAESTRDDFMEFTAIFGAFAVIVLAAIRHGHQLSERDLLLAAQAALLRSKEELIQTRKRAEAELRIASAAFESQEGIIITDADGLIVRVNQAFSEATGYSAEELVGKTPRILKSGRHDENFYREMWSSINRTGTWNGEIWDRRKNGELYPKWLTITAVKGDDGKVSHYVGSQIDITERKAAEEKIQDLAFYDYLTRLPNRRLLMDRLQQALASCTRSGRFGAMLFIDLDNFKTLNDTLGHDFGDILLKQVAERLKTCVREGDTVARLGGDEFVVVLEVLHEDPFEAASQTKAIGVKILSVLNQPYQLNSHEYRSSTSIGATLFNGMLLSIEELMKQADIAMYQVKKSGRHTLRFFDAQMQNSVNVHAALEAELHKALEKREFQLHYQMQVDSSNQVLGAEALVRWVHPERGMVSPAQFIPIAEESELILHIGAWVLETACSQLKSWEHNDPSRDLVLAVNVSAKQFRQDNFVDQVRDVLLRHEINTMRLKLELTEGVMLEDIEGTIATMNQLKELGIQLSLDDFGTGYSSLQYLKKLPLEQLKIDQSFVRDITTDSSDKAIVRTIIAMAHSMNLNVIAEGVETEEQRQLLLQMGCTHFQGYLFGRPIPIDQFDAMLRQH